ncbi:RadC family protein [Oceanicaulis alexandrii]|uniref:RadC family protein n=1 Tax=Oceanicaulis alexandrii TaxID=153233 RepID=UPI002352CB00|nr:DNA repair protein RadC [Oceanicaulis alexandrii]
MSDLKTIPDTPHHAGHRDRLRARFSEAGGQGLADYELLELALFRSIPRRDVKPLAKALIARFGSLGGVCAAELHQLKDIKGVSEKTALDLKLLEALAVRMAREQVVGRPVLSSWSALLDYLRTALQHASTEQFRVLYLDKKNRLAADEHQARGTVDHAPVYPREVVKRALALDASALILVHNHPSGDPTPSHADIEMTKLVISAAKPFNIVVHDHLVIGRERTASFKSLGLL